MGSGSSALNYLRVEDGAGSTAQGRPGATSVTLPEAARAGLVRPCDPLAEYQPVTTGHLDHKATQAPGMVGQDSDDPHAAGRAI